MPLRLRGRVLRVPLAALAAVVAVVLLAAAMTVAWQHRTLAYATTLDTHDEAALLAPAPPQVADDAAHLASILTPVKTYRVSARFGERSAHWRTRHTGFDFVAPWGTPVRAIQDGVVVKLAWNPAFGKMVILQVAPGITIWYCHLSRVTAHLGPVKAGQTLGRVGATGNATGPHLHLEVRVDDRPTDPEIYLFGPHPGVPGPPAPWYPFPGNTVAGLAVLHGH